MCALVPGYGSLPPALTDTLTVRTCIYPPQVSESDVIAKQWKKRARLIAANPDKQKEWTDYPTYPTVADAGVESFCTKVSAQLVMYRSRKGEFARNWIFSAAEGMPAYEWWEQYGSSVPELQTVACMVLSQPSSASIIERINSEFAFVKDRRRNRLGAHQVEQARRPLSQLASPEEDAQTALH